MVVVVVVVALCRFLRTGGEVGNRGDALWGTAVDGDEDGGGDGRW